MKEVEKLRPFTKFCVTIGMIPSSYKNSLTYEEQLLWLCNYLEETIIPAVNNNGEVVTELQNLYKELKNYVDNYFTSLDVQEEIDKKLDLMVENGTFQEIINENIFNELNDKINDISESTLINIVENIPQDKKQNTEYVQINYSEDLDITIPKSNYQLLKEAEILASQNLTNDIIRIATFNSFNQNTPYNLNVKGLYKYSKLRRIFDEMKCNIINCQEVINDLQLPISKFLITKFYKYTNFAPSIQNTKPLIDYGLGTFSNIPSQSFEKIIYNEQNTERRIFTKSLYSYNNKIISVFNTHIQQIVAQAQINELFEAVQSDTSPYKIICGDFNINLLTQSETYFSKFLNAGFKQVNNGQYLEANDNKTAFSEILVSNNIDIVNSEMFINNIKEVSDHFPIIADLKLN